MSTMKRPGLMSQPVPGEENPSAAPAGDEGDEPETEEEALASEDQRKVIETIVAGLRDHIFGAAEESIREKLRNSQDIPRDIGNMTLPLVMEAGRQATAEGIEADFSLLLPVAAEVIDDMLEMAEAIGVIEEITDDDRQESMLAAVMAYLASADVPPEEREEAKAMLAQMQEDGSVDDAVNDIRALGARKGVDPFAGGEQVPPAQPTRMMQG